MTIAKESPVPRDATACTGSNIQDLLDALASRLESHAGHLNALNVFPVPDGDTGINMSRTLRAAADAASSATGSAADVLAAASRGALLGAAGNSGVILSQMLRGFTEVYATVSVLDGNGVKRALEAASQAGYKSVAQPVEGTILSVARGTAEAIQPGVSIVLALSQAARGAAEAVEATPTQLEKLRAAGVVDAGGEGYRLIIDGAHRWMLGEDIRAAIGPATVSRALIGAQHTGGEVGFCTQFIIQHSTVPIQELKAEIEEMSTSVIVVGTEDIIRVHAHAGAPGQVLDLAVRSGNVSRISIENMEMQNESAREETDTGLTGIVAVAQSETAARLLESLGASSVVIPAAASPTVQELLNAVQRLGHEHILIMPNDKNSALTAEQLRGLTPRSIHIVPTENVVQCTQCLLAFNPDQAIDLQELRLSEALGGAKIIELARANRAADLPHAQVTIGSIVAIYAGQVIASATAPSETIALAMENIEAGSPEIATLYPCAELDPAALPELEAQLRALLPSAEHETVPLDLPARLALVSLE